MLIPNPRRSKEGMTPPDIARQIKEARDLVAFFDELPKSSESDELQQVERRTGDKGDSTAPRRMSDGDAGRAMEQVMAELEEEAAGGVSQASLALLVAAREGDLEEMLAAIEAGADVNVVEPQTGMRPLHYTVVVGNLDALARMVEWGADVNALQGDGPLGGGGRLTPLMCACIPRNNDEDLPPVEVRPLILLPGTSFYSCLPLHKPRRLLCPLLTSPGRNSWH